MSWTWNSHTYSLTHSNVICWCARNTFGLIWKMTLLFTVGRSYATKFWWISNLFFFSMLLPFLPTMQLFAYAKSNTFYLGITVIRYQILMGYYNFFLVWGLVTLVLWPTRFRRHRWKLTRSFFISSSIKFKLNRNTFCSFLLNFFKL